MGTSFASDIAPFLAPYRDNMLWRLDLGDYEAVKANAAIIYGKIDPANGSQMPPAPLPPLEPADVTLFHTWMSDGCPP